MFVQPESVDFSPAFQELETSRAKSKFKGTDVIDVIEYVIECLWWSQLHLFLLMHTDSSIIKALSSVV